MSSEPEKFSNLQINDETENSPEIKMNYNKDDSISISVNSQITADNSKNNSVRSTRKNKISKIQRSLTSTLFLSNKNTLYIEDEFFPDKEDSAIDLLFFIKQNENQEKKDNVENKIEIKENKIVIKENKIEICENKIENEENKIEIKDNKIEVKEEEIKNNVNNIKISCLNKNTYIKNSENLTVNKNMHKNIKEKTNKNDNFSQTYNRSDFKDKPPKVSSLFLHHYDYENKNIFSYSNDTDGIIKESKKISNIFCNHLLINKENNKRYITTSLNSNNDGKLSTFIFYAPRNTFV